MELRRLRGLSPATARQLFSSTVAPVVDYASNVWMHAYKNQSMGPINRVQRVGAQAIVGTLLTIATSVAEAEAHIATAQHRFWRRAVKMWADLHTLPETNPLRRNIDRIRKFRRYHHSPLYQVADALKISTWSHWKPSTRLHWPHGKHACRLMSPFLRDQLYQAEQCRLRSAARRGMSWSGLEWRLRNNHPANVK